MALRPHTPEVTAPMPASCQNCAAPLAGDYCSQCGQSTAEFDLPIGEFAKEVAAEALSLDSRLRITMKSLLFKPGEVPSEFVRGHRARFVPPVRLYLFASFAMFLMLALGPGVNVQNVRVNGEAVADTSSATPAPPLASDSVPPSDTTFGDSFGDRLTQGLTRVRGNNREFSQDFFGRMAQAFFVLLPAFALLLKVFYRRRLYIHHLVFATYLHSLAFIVVAVVAVPDALGLPQVGRWAAVLLLSVPIYAFIAMLRFYGEGRLKTLAKFVGVSLAYGFLSVAAWIGILIFTLLAS